MIQSPILETAAEFCDLMLLAAGNPLSLSSPPVTAAAGASDLIGLVSFRSLGWTNSIFIRSLSSSYITLRAKLVLFP
jgi:hypothetical protein